MTDELEFAVDLERSVEEVWTLITDPSAFGTWMLGTFAFEPAAGSPLTFRADDHYKEGVVTEVDSPRRFSWQWSDGVDESEVAIQLDGNDRRCTVTITEARRSARRWSRPSIPPMEASVA